MDQCQSLLEEDMADELSDELMKLSISEASRYSSLHPVSSFHFTLVFFSIHFFDSFSRIQLFI